MIGTTISHYKILEKLGEGGMGVVYKAQDTKLNRTVALKFLPEHISASEADTARFMQEAQAAASLNHPNICTIHGIEEADGKQFIVMEFVDGQTLQEKKSSLSMKQALDIGIQISDGLAAAHEKGIVHRDIKPENIMFRKDGRVQIMDFGLAKLRGASRLTKEGSTVGTAGYMSPEQVQGHETDHRSDIFSLGVLLYEMLAGQLPFKGVHETAIAYEIVNVDSPPMSSIRSEIPPELDAIVLECMEKDPNERTQAAKQVAIDLKRHKRESGRTRTLRALSVSSAGVSTHPEHSPDSSSFTDRMGNRKERIFWATAVIVLLSLVGVLFFQRDAVEPSKRISSRFIIAPPGNSSINETVVSPDGNTIAFTTRGVQEFKPRIWVRHLIALEPEPVPGTDNAKYPFWSPDSRFLGFFADGKLKKIDLNAGAAIELCDAPQAYGGTWNSEDEILYSSFGSIFRVSGRGGVPKEVSIKDPSPNYRREYRWPVFLPDGKRFLFLQFGRDEVSAKTFITSLQDSTPRELLESLANVLFAPPSHVLFLRGRTLMSQLLDLDAGTLLGEPKPVALDVGTSPLEVLGDFSCSGAGVLTTGGGRAIRREYRWFERSGKTTGSLVDPGDYFDVSISSSGGHAAVQRGDQNRNSDLWMVDLTRGVMSRFTFDPSTDDDPTWAPDGKYLYYSNTRSGTYAVYRKLASGLGDPEEVTPAKTESQIPSSISPDGDSMLYLVGNRGSTDIWVMELHNKKQYPLIATPYDETFAEFSPDGKWVCYSSNESGRSEIYVRSFSSAGGRWQVSREGGSQPHWRQDGRELFYIAPDLKLMSVTVRAGATLAFDTPQPLFQTRIDLFDGPKRFAVADNGRRFLMNVPVGEAYANPVTVTINPDL